MPTPRPSILQSCVHLCVCATALASATARAQVASPPPVATPSVATPSVVPTPSELAPRSPAPGPSVDLLPTRPDRADRAPVPRELGKPEDELTLDVTGYSLADDAPPALRAALSRLTAPYVGPKRSYEDLVDAAAEATRFLQRELGYYLGYAYIPEQDAKDHVVRIGVLEGRLDRVMLNWSDDLPVKKEVVQAYLDHLHPGDILTVRDVERVVFLVNDLRGITVKAEVKAGSRPGTAILEFTPRADRRVDKRVDADLNGSRFIGLARLGGLVSVNSPAGRGDGFTATGLASTSGGLKFALLGYTLPIGSDGFKAGTSLSATRYELDPASFPLHLDGDSHTGNLFGLYPWVRSRNLNVFGIAATDYKSYLDRIAGVQAKKNVTDLSLGVTGDFRDSLWTGGVNTFEVNLAAGRLRYGGGLPTGIDDAPDFKKLTFGYSRLQDLVTGRLMGYLSVNGQFALDNLDTTEQFRAGGPDGVRAFAPGEGTGDSGLVVTTELRLLPSESWFGKYARELVFGVFADGALVEARHDPNLIPRDASYRNRAGYAGAGVSVVWQRTGTYAMRMSLASPIHGTARSDTLERNPRVYLQFSYFF